ncbi:uncharacterized protein TM35_000073340 [Trypanosoma theileri]|uniref:Uncharacterized protein n=1 Tax=Trypanosoma theileri TaxID=67003 RepID=A0A1X0P3B5_9TRYP|nr:uncharacterized protein TM35_000073340 [Trypanosoma theileri]ORC90910.1 hypothetical protein TM35_000073340 [Trypanosoma theileri]
MGPKKGSKKLEEVPPAVEDPLLAETSRTAMKWAARVAVNSRRVVEVQQLLGIFSAQVEVVNRELTDVYDNAQLLSMLRIVDYRQKLNPSPTPVTVKKQKRRDNNTRVSIRPPVDENSTEALVAAMDEKKRAKVSAALVNLFRRNQSDTPSSSQAGVSPLSPQSPPQQQLQLEAPASPTDASGKQQFSSGFSSDGLNNNTPTFEHRRPKDVPPELWDEVSKLRMRRIVLEDRLAVLMGRIDSQLKRFDLLMQNYGVTMYASDAMEHNLSILRAKKS